MVTDLREIFWDIFPDSLLYAGLDGFTLYRRAHPVWKRGDEGERRPESERFQSHG